MKLWKYLNILYRETMFFIVYIIYIGLKRPIHRGFGRKQ